MKDTVLRKWYIYVPIWLTLYVLPLPAHIIFVIFTLSDQSLLQMLAAFWGTFIMGLILYFPVYCCYYGVISFLHTLIDEIFLCDTHKVQRLVTCILSFMGSALLIISSIGIYLFLEVETWVFLIPIALTLLGLQIVFALVGGRLVIEGIWALAAMIKQRSTT